MSDAAMGHGWPHNCDGKKEAWKLWFPEGKDDPSICLIHFSPEDGEYWNNAGAQGLKYAFEAVKAYVKGTTPESDHAHHAKVDL